MGKIESAPQLCWLCAKAGGGCAWSDRFEPVDGWTARPTRLRLEGKLGRDSYEVVQCPEFKPESVHKMKRIDDDGARLLCNAVLAKAGKDYVDDVESIQELKTVPTSQKTQDIMKDLETDKRMIENLLQGGCVYTDLLCLDGDDLLRSLKRTANRR